MWFGAAGPRCHRRHLLTVADYYAMGRAGILAPDAQVEIIGGEVVDMAPIDSRHAATVETLANLLRQAVEGIGIVRTKSGITLDPYSEPIPHVTLLKPQSQDLDVRPPAGYALADRPDLSAPLEIIALPTVAVDLNALFPSS